MKLSSFMYSAVLILSCFVTRTCESRYPSSINNFIKYTTNNDTDELALFSFKALIDDGPSHALASWSSAESTTSLRFCRWRGITCGERSGQRRVISLDLESLQLTGSISPYLANLTFLERLNLPDNQLHGPIPQELTNLAHLQHLNLSYNSLQGRIPIDICRYSDLRNISLRSNTLQGEIPSELSHCHSLQRLDLSSNSLLGSIPPSLGNLSVLDHLYLSYNDLTGDIPPSLGKLSVLDRLALSNNYLTGNIPPSLGNLFMLSFLDLSSSGLTGDIPSSFWNLSSLTILGMSDNNFSGVLPPNLGLSLPHLQFLTVTDNQFHGHIPPSLSNASSLWLLEMSSNHFSGLIPHLGNLQNLYRLMLDENKLEAGHWGFLRALTNCTNLRILGLDNNEFGRPFPHSIANLSTQMERLSMQGCLLSGTIPAGITNLVNLVYLILGVNRLQGTIPDSIGRMQNLGVLGLYFNQLSGDIPPSIGNLTRLNTLYLHVNNFIGNIPTTLGNCKNLQLLALNYNKFSGTIPREILSITSFSTLLDLADNLLTGQLPQEIRNLKNLQSFHVSRNLLAGEIPDAIGECVLLQNLHMGGNFFEGTIPTSFRSLKGLEELDLSQNNLSGSIPEFLLDLPFIRYLNLSFNNFEGEVPSGRIVSNASALFSVVGNSRLCGGDPKLKLLPCPETASSGRKHWNITVLVIIISVVVPILGLIFLSILILFCIRRSKDRSPGNACTEGQIMTVSYSELRKATDGFSDANLIGAGSFGSVYKGTMPMDWSYDEKVVAVKVLNLQQRGAIKSFMAECEALRHVRHRNLVSILTSCSSIDSQGNDFRALLYKLYPNGSLDEWLHPRANDSRRRLNLLERINISVDVAAALEYLHHHGLVPVVHCDLKPSNVLLDEDMTAHVGDFGLARFLDKTQTSSSILKGSVGYVAPEYGMANKVATHGDVYSYGVLLLEMFTGKRPTDGALDGDLSLRKFVEMAFPSQAMDVVDPLLFLDEEDGEAQDETPIVRHRDTRGRVAECIASVLSIGLSCSQELPTERMDMAQVSRDMHAIRGRFLSSNI